MTDNFDRKRQVLTQDVPAKTRSLANAVIIKDGDLFLVIDRDAKLPLKDHHGFGLYYHDCRYLDGFELRIAGIRPTALAASGWRGNMAVFDLTNVEATGSTGERVVKETIGVRWERRLDGSVPAVFEKMIFRNFGFRPVELNVALTFHAPFDDVFEVRALIDRIPREVIRRSVNDGLIFESHGRDGTLRSLLIAASREAAVSESSLRFRLDIEPEQSQELELSLTVREGDSGDGPPHAVNINTRWSESVATLESDSISLNDAISQSMRDLAVLRSSLNGEHYFAAGLPWFGTLFGRDSIISAMQILAFEKETAEQTLRLLAKYQGANVDEWRDEEPGKILHEHRVGELARLREIPHTPYYGSVDATPLFLILIAEHAAWTGSLDLFHELQPHVESALRWMEVYGDADRDGYIEYHSRSTERLINQGWKDAGDSIVDQTGAIATPPIALVEVQGYACAALEGIAGVFRHSGDDERAVALEQRASELRARIKRDFWWEEEKFYALGLDGQKRQIGVASSNPGHLLWSGAVDSDHAADLAARLMRPDLFNGWGVRTLSTLERRYNPVGYHLGTVWPHENALIVAGLRRYGLDEPALLLFQSLFEAALRFEDRRLPELFAGFSREDYDVPVRYPVACHPQAWAAGSVPYMTIALLGLRPDALNGRLFVTRPKLPRFVDRLSLRGVRIGEATVDLHFTREGEEVTVRAEVSGEIAVIVE